MYKIKFNESIKNIHNLFYQNNPFYQAYHLIKNKINIINKRKKISIVRVWT